MHTITGLVENFGFMVLEVTKQVEDAYAALEDPDEVSLDRVEERDDYIDNLKDVIESKCYSLLVQLPAGDDGADPAERRRTGRLKAVNTIANNLERIGDMCSNVVRQTAFIEDIGYIHRRDYRSFFDVILAALKLIPDALLEDDVTKALEICRAEFETDRYCDGNISEILIDLRYNPRHTADLVTYLLIVRYLERLGDALLNIGEAIISSVVGEKLRIYQYRALEETLGAEGVREDDDDGVRFSLAPVGQTRSGCRVGRVTERRDDGYRRVIFKEGKLRKIAREKENLERWEELVPGLPPRVFGFESRGDYGSILIENLNGATLQSLVVGGDQIRLTRARRGLFAALEDIWSRTLEPGPVNAGFMRQLNARRPSVERVHPGLFDNGSRICNLEAPPLGEQLRRAAELEDELEAPFSIFIHGDFNLDNVIFDAENGRVHFIDVNRSRRGDYVQDVSVFLVSNFRLPVFDPAIRNRLEKTMGAFLAFARDFARRRDDVTFQARLTLGLVRSLVTSTRFTLDAELARAMILRAQYLLDNLLDGHDGSWESFELTAEALAI